MTEIVDLRHVKIKRDNSPIAVTKGGQGVLIIFKTASRSMLQTGRRSKVSNIPASDELHVFVRDPIDRLKSAFQFFTDLQERRKRHNNVEHFLPRLKSRFPTMTTWEDFVDRVLAGEKNHHWKPVSEILKKVKREVQIHKFEDINEEYPLGKLEKRNTSKKQDSINLRYREDEIKALYAEDYRLRDNDRISIR